MINQVQNNYQGNNDIINSFTIKLSDLLGSIQTDQIICANRNYTDIIAITKPNKFIPVNEYLPVMEPMGEWYCSMSCALLIKDSRGKLSIENGFLAKWVDEECLFWYEDDAIDNVVAWMPYPKRQPTKSKRELIADLQKNHNPLQKTLWTPDLKSEQQIHSPDCFTSVKAGVPPMYNRGNDEIQSDTVLVEYEYSTANGIFTGLATSKIYLDKESEDLKWDNSDFYSKHSFVLDVIQWIYLPEDILNHLT